MNNSFVTHISYIFADIVFIVGYKDTLTMSSILRIQLHGSMEGCTTSSEKIKDINIFIKEAIRQN